MSTHYFNGPCKWAKLSKPDEKYQKYSIEVLLDMDQYTALKATKVKNNGKPGELGTPDAGKMWVTFRRKQEDGAPSVVDTNGNSISDIIGNGSEVTVKFEVDSFVSKKWGTVVRSKLESVRVDKLVVYDPDTPKEDTPLKPRLMF